jgi:hypothetical protein
MSGVHKLTLQVRAPRGNFPGQVDISYWCIADQHVVLCNENGRPIGAEKRLIGPGDDPRLLAVAMMKRRRSSNFSDHISYPKLGRI